MLECICVEFAVICCRVTVFGCDCVCVCVYVYGVVDECGLLLDSRCCCCCSP